MATARASDLPKLIVSGADSPRSRIGRGLESIGGMTAETLQRISTTVGGVVKSPVVLMSKVGGLASPRAATPTAPPGSSLEERVYHLEIQMKRLEEKFNSMTVVTEVDLSTCSYKEKPWIAKSLLQEMEMDMMLEKRVQMLEDRINERMERFEKALSNIQSRLDHVNFSKRENVVGCERQESLSVEESPLPPTFEVNQKDFSKEHLAATPNIKPTQELATQGVVSIAFASLKPPMTSKFVEKPLVVVPSANFEEPAHEDTGDKSVSMTAIGELPKAFAFQDTQEDFVKESLADTLEAGPTHDPSSQEDLSTTSDMTLASFESPMACKSTEEPSTTTLGVNFEELTQKDTTSKSGSMIAIVELPLASSLEEPQEESVKEFMAGAPNVESTQVLKTQEDNGMQVAALESQMTSKFVEEPSIAAPSADFEELVQEDVVDKIGLIGTTMVATKSSLVYSLEESKEGFEKESMAFAPSGEPTQEHNDMAIASFETKGASKFVEEALVATPSANFGEHEHKADVDKSGTIIASVELPLASSFDDPLKIFEKESLVATPNARPIHEPSSQEYLDTTSNKALASLEPQLASKFVEEPSLVVQSANFDEPTHEDEVDKSVTMTTSTDSPLASLYQGPLEDFEKKSLTTTPSDGPIHKPSSLEDSGATSNVALALSDLPGGSKFIEEPSSDIPSANFEELAQEDGVAKSDTIIVDVKSPLASSFEEPQEDFEKESMVVVSSLEPTQELTTQEESDIAPTSSEPKVTSKFVDEPSAIVPSANLEECAYEDATNKSVTMTTPRENPHEDFVKESLATPPNVGPIHKLSSQEDLDGTSDMAFDSSTPHLASEFVEKPSLAILSANYEELTHDEDVVKSNSMSVGADSPLASLFEEPQEDFEKELLAVTSSHESIQGFAMENDSHIAPTSFKSQEVSKFVEEPSTIVPNVNFEEPTHEDIVDKSIVVTVVGVSPFASSFEVPQDDSKKESTIAASNIKHAQELTTQEDSNMAPFKPQVASKFMEEPLASNVPSAKFEEPVHEDTIDRSDSVTVAIESPSMSSLKAHMEDYTKESLAAGVSAKVLETTEEDESGKSPIAFVPLEVPSTSFFEIPQEASSKEPSGTSVQVEELAQEKSGIMLLDANSTLASTVEEGNYATKEVEYKLIEDFKVHHEHIKSIEKEFSSSQSNLDYVNSNESLAMEDNDGHLESDQSSEEFFDAEHGSGNFRPWEFDEPKSFEEFGVGSNESEQQSTQELGHELEQKSKQQPVQEPKQEDLTRNSAMALLPLDPQVTSKFGESQEVLVEESLAVVPSTKFEEPPQANVVDESGTRDLLLTSTTEKTQIDTVVSLEKSLSSASFHQSSNLELLENLKHKSLDIQGTSSTPQEALEREPLTTAPTTKIAHGHDARKSNSMQISLEPQLEESKEALANEPTEVVPSSESLEPTKKVDDGQCSAILAFSEPQLTPTLEKPQEGFVKEPLVDVESTSKSMDLGESLADEPLAVTTSTKLVQENSVDQIDVGLVEESPLTPIVEDPQNGNMSSLVKGKHGQDAIDQKFLEDVKIIAKPIKEAIPRTQSDLTHVKLNPEVAEDATKLKSQGNFLALGATLVDSKDALVKEPLPSSKLLELFEEENNSGKSGLVLADFPMTSRKEELQKPLAEDLSASAKLVPKDHARRRGFARSSTEPQFADKLEEHQKALAKESSVVAIPSASKLSEEYAQEGFGDKILGEGKHPQKEVEFKLVESVKSPVMKSEITSSPYVLEPMPSKIKEKKKKEKKPDATTKEKEGRLLLGLGEMERKSSLRVEEKDSKYSPRAEGKRKQPFRHLRDRLRHAFSINKEP